MAGSWLVFLKQLNDRQFKILSRRPFNCWSDIDNQETKQMTSLPADAPDKLNGRQSVDSETIWFMKSSTSEHD